MKGKSQPLTRGNVICVLIYFLVRIQVVFRSPIPASGFVAGFLPVQRRGESDLFISLALPGANIPKNSQVPAIWKTSRLSALLNFSNQKAQEIPVPHSARLACQFHHLRAAAADRWYEGSLQPHIFWGQKACSSFCWKDLGWFNCLFAAGSQIKSKNLT